MKRIESKSTEKRKTSEREKNRLFKLKKNGRVKNGLSKPWLFWAQALLSFFKQNFDELKPS